MKILSIALENHPGSLAELLETLAKAKVNVHAVEAQAMGDFGGVRLLVAEPEKCAQIVRKAGFKLVEADVVELQLEDKPGELAKVARKLAEARVNIVALFGTTPVSGRGRVLLRTNNPDGARKALGIQ